jgi:hypothetical protein
VWRKGTGSGTLSIEKDLLRDEGVDYEFGDKLVRASRPTDDDTLGEVLPTDDDTLGEVFWWYTTEKLLYSRWEYKDVAREVQSPVWLLAEAANDLLTSPQASHTRRCASSTCQWLFLDTSKNHTRRWCDMKVCGNRNKARRFHLRQAAG